MSDGADAATDAAGSLQTGGDARRDVPGEETSELDALRRRNEQLEDALARRRGLWSFARYSTGRRFVATLLVVLALVLAPVSVLTVWTNNTITNEDQYVATVTPLAANPDIQAAVTTRLTNRIYDKLDVPSIVHQVLPPKASQLEGPLGTAVKSFVRRVVAGVVASAAFQKIWVEANRAAHRQVVGALEGTSSGGIKVQNGTVQLDLSTLVTTVKQKLVDAGLTGAASIPTVDATITLYRSPQLQRYQRVFQVLNTLGFWLPVAVVVLLVFGVWLSRDRRRTFVAIGVLVALGMLLLELGLSLVRAFYLAHLPSSVQSPAAAAAAFDILVHFLRQAAWGLFAFGLALAAGAFLAGPSVSARALRRGSTTGMGRLGDQMEVRGWLPHGLRAFFAASRRGFDVGLVTAAVVSLVLWRGRTVWGVVLAALLLVLSLLVVEGLGRPSTALGGDATSQAPPVSGEGGATGGARPPEQPAEKAAS